MTTNRNAIFGLIGSLRERYGKFLEKELKAHGIEGLVSSHGSIFACLYQSGGRMKVLEIAKRIGRSKSTVTELVNKLEAMGYVSKASCCLDGRCTYVALTDQGRAVKDHFDEISRKLLDTAYQGFTEEEKETLVRALEKMRRNF
ncbi:MAG: MarR family transcriptional regulator [Syntrophales bacterium]|nr:MarR family transcriptional regulator [Syntrophales bacterium]